VAAGKQRSLQGEGCRWLLMPGGGGEVRGREVARSECVALLEK